VPSSFVKRTFNFIKMVWDFNLHRTSAVLSCTAILVLDVKSDTGRLLTSPKTLELLLAWNFF